MNLANREARQDAPDDLNPEQFANIDDAYYALEASTDVESVNAWFTTSSPRRGRNRSQNGIRSYRCGVACGSVQLADNASGVHIWRACSSGQ